MRIRRIAFAVAGDTVVGDLHLPAAMAPWPAAIVAGPMTSVKEQVAGTYARALAERGIATLAIDHRHFGQSGGMPRQYEHHGRKVEDLRAAITALSADVAIDATRIGAVGVCLGAGYAATATAEDFRIRALAMVAGYYRHPAEMRERDPLAFDAKIEEGRRAREQYEAMGEVRMVPAAALSGDAAMQTPDTVDYYTRRAVVENYVNAFAVMSREHFLTFDVQSAASRLRVPTLMLHSEHALSPTWARRFHDAIVSPKRLAWIESRAQTDLYDDPILVAQACDAVAAHLHAMLV
jgi:fermentation-respiration switch protein FrsA (DUF1100 family)